MPTVDQITQEEIDALVAENTAQREAIVQLQGWTISQSLALRDATSTILVAAREIAALKAEASAIGLERARDVPWKHARSREEAEASADRYAKAEADEWRKYGNDTP